MKKWYYIHHSCKFGTISLRASLLLKIMFMWKGPPNFSVQTMNIVWARTICPFGPEHSVLSPWCPGCMTENDKDLPSHRVDTATSASSWTLPDLPLVFWNMLNNAVMIWSEILGASSGVIFRTTLWGKKSMYTQMIDNYHMLFHEKLHTLFCKTYTPNEKIKITATYTKQYTTAVIITPTTAVIIITILKDPVWMFME